jgi:hypothetical protein
VKLQEVSAQILTKQSDRASPNSVILTATIIIIIGLEIVITGSEVMARPVLIISGQIVA